MAGYTAADVKRLRDETDAPMMECKTALEEAGGDFEKAKEILREKGKAVAGKKAGRDTNEGVVAVSHSEHNKRVGGVVLLCETDFVAKNETFLNGAQELAEIFMQNDPGDNPLAVQHGDKTVQDIIDNLIAVIRENIQLKQAIHLKTEDNSFTSYVHHDRKKGVIVEVAGSAANGHDVGRQVAIQAVAFPPEFISKDEVPADLIAKEMEVETQRAMNEGKPENIARNIAQGRINKEYMQKVVLLEQPFYREPGKSVSQYLSEESKVGGGEIKIASFHRLQIAD